MVVTAEFLFDFGSPNAYLVHRAIPTAEARGQVRFDYVPVLLGGIFKAIGNQSPMTAYGHITAKRDYDRLEMHRFMTRHDINGFRMNPHFPVNTLLAMRGAIAAQQLGVAEDYIEAMFAAMWELGLKLDEPDVWHRTLVEAGLPADALTQGAADPAHKAMLVNNTEQAVARGAFGSPTFFIGEEMWFGKDRLRDVEEAAAATAA
ncbi:MAG TPA: 2-hydroxychromene-2-carboxylate isomerase [Novosphingobium sp.]|nr:2-hydroxychromene-2-carboxylate isomerase [Novosphingobium sp.]